MITIRIPCSFRWGPRDRNSDGLAGQETPSRAASPPLRGYTLDRASRPAMKATKRSRPACRHGQRPNATGLDRFGFGAGRNID
jgi:hypothetical protein